MTGCKTDRLVLLGARHRSPLTANRSCPRPSGIGSRKTCVDDGSVREPVGSHDSFGLPFGLRFGLRLGMGRGLQGVTEEGLEIVGSTLFLFSFLSYLRSVDRSAPASEPAAGH